MKPTSDYELEALLELDGFEFDFAMNYVVKYEVRRVAATKGAHQGSNIASRCTIQRERGSTE
jgi:hypothetical protein